MAAVTLGDVIVPEVFTPYMLQRTMELSELIASGAVVADAAITALLNGPGLTFNVPSYKDLANDADNVSSDTGSASTPKGILTLQEIAVRCSRNQHWGAADLVSDLIGNDPMDAIASRVAAYWTRRLQSAMVATMQGVYADNAAAPTGTDTHTQNDMTYSIIGGGYTPGVTDFSAEAVIDAAVTMGDGMKELTMIAMHSIVYAKAQKNNLIDFIPDSNGVVNIPTFLGRRVIVDDGLPNPAGAGAAQTAAGIYHTWLFGAGALRLGFGGAKVPTAVERDEAANNGAGTENLHSRVQFAIHPAGHAFIGSLTGTPGGPNNTTNANQLAHADSWSRVFPERKQIKMARLITREA